MSTDDPVTQALIAADFCNRHTPDAHNMKVLAEALRQLRIRTDPSANPVGTAPYVRGWDDAARMYRKELDRLRRVIYSTGTTVSEPKIDLPDECEVTAADIPISPAYAAKINQDLLEACRAQHNALDTVMAQLIILTQRHTPEEMFFPSKSGIVWDAVTRGHAAIERAQRSNSA